jgi:hypothetical protein
MARAPWECWIVANALVNSSTIDQEKQSSASLGVGRLHDAWSSGAGGASEAAASVLAIREFVAKEVDSRRELGRVVGRHARTERMIR